MTLLCRQCIHCLHQVGVTGERLSCESVIGLQQLADVVLLCLHTHELLPCQVVFQIAPQTLNRVQLRTVGRSEDEAHVRGPHEPLRSMEATVVQEQEVQAVGEGLREGVHEEWETLRIEIGEFEKESLPRRGRHGPIDIEPFKDVLHRADGLYTEGGEAAAAPRQQTEATFVLAQDPHRAGMLRRHDPLQRLKTCLLKRWNGFRGFLCGWAAAP
jgi:hypothetical protein